MANLQNHRVHWLLLALLAAAPALGAGPSEFGIAVLRDVDRVTLRELAPFSSLVPIWSDHPRFDDRVRYARLYGLKTVVNVSDIFYDVIDPPGPERPFLVLRPGYRGRWQAFVERHLEVLGPDTIRAFYLADEPYWNGLDATDVEAVHRLVESSFPLIDTMCSLNTFDIEMSPAELPADVLDVVGFQMYGVPNPLAEDPEYQRVLELFQQKFGDRQLMIVVDAYWTPGLHGNAGLVREEMGTRAREYREVAESIGAQVLGAFHWDLPEVGLREFPAAALREYQRIGAETSGKCGVPAAVEPLRGETTLFLHDCRFFVTVEWTGTANGGAGDGIAVPFTRDTGLYWFFSADNIELTVKVLDGRAINGYWWVFWSQMTTLDLVVNVHDTRTGEVRTYTEPARDTSAFAE